MEEIYGLAKTDSPYERLMHEIAGPKNCPKMRALGLVLKHLWEVHEKVVIMAMSGPSSMLSSYTTVTRKCGRETIMRTTMMKMKMMMMEMMMKITIVCRRYQGLLLQHLKLGVVASRQPPPPRPPPLAPPAGSAAHPKQRDPPAGIRVGMWKGSELDTRRVALGLANTVYMSVDKHGSVRRRITY